MYAVNTYTSCAYTVYLYDNYSALSKFYLNHLFKNAKLNSYIKKKKVTLFFQIFWPVGKG